MDVFDLRSTVVDEYAAYIKSFLRIKDPSIAGFVDESLKSGRFWPDPLVQVNPSFEPGETIDTLVARGLLHDECRRIFRRSKDANGLGVTMHLHRHQQEALEVAAHGGSYVLTTGTGSGKSLAYFVPIVDHVLRHGSRTGIKAIVVYPMNALCNSQLEELARYLRSGYGEGHEPVTFARYTGQENAEARAKIAASPPDILLTNFMMLELLLTRTDADDQQVIKAASGLEFLVLDELHTYRGRQGADVAMLVRRVRERCGAPTMRCIGTSATLAGSGTREDRQAEVSQIATRLFGDEVTPAHVIGETLRAAITRPAPDRAELRAALARTLPGEMDYEAVASHPLAAWSEQTFGLQRDARGRLERRRPITLSEAAETLSVQAGIDAESCRRHLQATLLAGYRVHHPDTGLPLFAFRLHQFISRGDTVFASIESRAERHLALEGQVYVPGTRDRRLFPLAFCRECGQDYYVVDLHRGHTLEPRELGAVQSQDPDAVRSGFLFVGDWVSSVETLPEDWLEIRKNGDVVVKAANREWQPQQVYVAPDGEVGRIGIKGGVEGWFFPAPFRFCLTCQVSYVSNQRSDFGKLASLSTEGRSTATTILSLSIVRALRQIERLAPSARKLLSFTDNRQDASLQAGHFNDFIQIGLLRAALYAAVAAAGPEGLGHDTIAQRVTDEHGLALTEFATNPEVQFAARTNTLKALRDVVGYRIYRDLRRGWRVTSPNLEQCGLLRVEYEALDQLCASEVHWRDRHPILRDASPDERQRACRVVLDTLRRQLAIKVPYLDHDSQEAIGSNSYQYLREPWGLEEGEELESAPVFRVLPRQGKPQQRELSVSPTSGLGRFLRRASTWPRSFTTGAGLPAKELESLAQDLFEVLCIGGHVERVESGQTPLYQLQAGAIRWLAGDGTPPEPDPVTVPRPPDRRQRERDESNVFFGEFYRTVALTLRGTEAREHTAQVPALIREQREAQFRDGLLPVLYCSPTMELGVDIADLNAVNMRNVPPTPANYAQRSGRAGRQGQPALVLTYCSSTSPHDQYFFRRQPRMVAGAVTPPRLDLANEDLVRAHLHAVWLAETGQSLGSSLRDVLDLESAGPKRLPLRQDVASGLRDPHARKRAATRCDRILRALEPELVGTAWYRPGWLAGVIDGALLQFDAACDRWRGLYLAACQQRDQQHAIIVDASTSAEARTTATRLRGEAETQIRLLVDEAGAFGSDFYSYRYFASEGFLPGYNFPRLPLAAYLPGKTKKSGRDEFVSRPRFLAVSEFGPRSIIYHEGSRYRVNRVILPVREDGERTTQAKFCKTCGYGHFGVESQDEVCRDCGSLLSAGGAQFLGNLLKLDNVSTRRVDRITSDEEERLRQGYELRSAIRFAENTQGPLYTRAAFVDAEGPIAEGPIAEGTYAPTATIWRINLGWNRRKDRGVFGFYLDMERGYWNKKDSPGESETPTPDEAGQSPLTRVVPYVEDRRNALVLNVEGHHNAASVISLSYALKRGIEGHFQIEENELVADLLPTAADPRRMLFYEAAEGGAGVLARLVAEPDALARAAREALEVCHFDPESGADRSGAEGAAEPCEAACYNCLLSYGNQRDHRVLDRHLVRDLLLRLTGGRAQAGAIDDRDALLAALLARSQSELERRFVRFLAGRQYRLPDQAQPQLAQFGTRPDFFYSDPDLLACVYVDGPYHQFPQRRERDAMRTGQLEDAGYLVIRVGDEESWERAARDYGWVFGEGMSSERPPPSIETSFSPHPIGE